jgi:hypothetical protein
MSSTYKKYSSATSPTTSTSATCPHSPRIGAWSARVGGRKWLAFLGCAYLVNWLVILMAYLADKAGWHDATDAGAFALIGITMLTLLWLTIYFARWLPWGRRKTP